MKKAYEKPVLCIERFTLSQTIATGCGSNLDLSMATQQDVYACAWDIGEFRIFLNEPNCDMPADGLIDICYNGPQPGFNVFSS